MDVKSLKKRRSKAKAVKDRHWPMMEDVYDYIIPYRRAPEMDENGQNRVSEIYDPTAVIAGFRFAGKLQRDISPVDGQLYTLAPGPLVKPSQGQEVYDETHKLLSDISIVTASFNHSGEWDTAFWEMGLELVGGTGFMLMLEGESAEQPARYFAASAEEMLIDGGGFGEVKGIFWDRKWSLRAIRDTWPNAKFGKDAAAKEKDDPEDEVTLHMDTVWLPKEKRWDQTIWIEGDDKQIIRPVKSRSCPWLTPRYYKLANEVWGRGVGNLNMPAIKTLNTAQRITLLAAGIAMMGIYTAVDDGVFNPDLSPIEPGAFWKVRANGGMFGPSIQRIQPPQIDMSNIVVDDLRMSIKAGMLDDALPPDTGAVRSPTEIVERVRRLADDHLGAYGRLIREIVIPKAKRDIEIAYNKKLIPNNISIDQLLVRVQVTSPVALARETERVSNIVNWLEMVLSVATSSEIPVKYIAKVEAALSELGRAMQVPPAFIVTEKERGEMQAQDQAQAMAMALAQAQGVPGGDPAAVDPAAAEPAAGDPADEVAA